MDVANSLVYVVGPKRLHNELMLCKISCSTGLKGRTLADLDEVLFNCAHNTAQSRCLILYDYQSDSSSLPLTKLETYLSHFPPNVWLAFYNLRKNSGVESQAMKIGVRGFFYDDDTVDCLTKGVGNIFDGDLWVSRKQMVEYCLHGSPIQSEEDHCDHTLTRREQQVLSLVAKGATNEEIADTLCVSHHTIRTHIYNIFKKIHVSNRLQASNWASDHLHPTCH